MDESLLVCDEEDEQQQSAIEEILPPFYDFMDSDFIIDNNHPSNEVNWDELEVEQNVSSFEKYNWPSIVADEAPPIDYDWSKFFTKDLTFETEKEMVKWTQDYGRMHKQELVVAKHDKRGRTPNKN
ncbi:hypothetical protein ACHQM5_016006 [Ranunculus cassubicifolius]